MRKIGKALAIVLAMGAGAAGAEEVSILGNIEGPEGALYVRGNLYFVAWVAGTLSKWDGTKTTILNSEPGCGHNGVAITKHNTFLVTCSDHGAILELDLSGKLLRRWDADSTGQKLGSMNDVVVTANDGAYATQFGPYDASAVPSLLIGEVLYRAPGSGKWAKVAGDLNYANGVAVSPDQKTLYVSETVGNCILKFTIEPDGSLARRSNFALLNLFTKTRAESWWLGPDSMKVDGKGNIYVAQWRGGKVLKLSPGAKLLHEFDIAAGNGTTNVALGEGEKDLYVTVVKDPDDPRARGGIVRVANVE